MRSVGGDRGQGLVLDAINESQLGLLLDQITFCSKLPASLKHIWSIRSATSCYHPSHLQVSQSLFWLVAYFWHFSRAALALLLDPDLKEWAMRPTVSNCLCCDDATAAVEEDAESSLVIGGSQVPLCYVMEAKSEASDQASDQGEDRC